MACDPEYLSNASSGNFNPNRDLRDGTRASLEGRKRTTY
jgi:hypothetical protein